MLLRLIVLFGIATCLIGVATVIHSLLGAL